MKCRLFSPPYGGENTQKQAISVKIDFREQEESAIEKSKNICYNNIL